MKKVGDRIKVKDGKETVEGKIVGMEDAHKLYPEKESGGKVYPPKFPKDTIVYQVQVDGRSYNQNFHESQVV